MLSEKNDKKGKKTRNLRTIAQVLWLQCIAKVFYMLFSQKKKKIILTKDDKLTTDNKVLYDLKLHNIYAVFFLFNAVEVAVTSFSLSAFDHLIEFCSNLTYFAYKK